VPDRGLRAVRAGRTYRKSSEAAQLNAIASCHRADDLTKNGIEDVFNVALVKVRVLASDAPDEL
jgi:acetolactate synthase regulatory subunit